MRAESPSCAHPCPDYLHSLSALAPAAAGHLHLDILDGCLGQNADIGHAETCGSVPPDEGEGWWPLMGARGRVTAEVMGVQGEYDGLSSDRQTIK